MVCVSYKAFKRAEVNVVKYFSEASCIVAWTITLGARQCVISSGSMMSNLNSPLVHCLLTIEQQ